MDELRNMYIVHEEKITRVWPPERRPERDRIPDLERRVL
jgi:hypothetical protein